MESTHHPKRIISTWAGTVIEITGLNIGFAFLYLTSLTSIPILKFVALLFSWFCFWNFSHRLAHFIVGKLLGIRFLYYFIGRSSLVKLKFPIITSLIKPIPVLGIKIDKSSLKNTSRYGRSITYASGALASMLSPLIPFFYALIYTEQLIAILIGILTIGNIIFTLYFSSKVGDFYKAKKGTTKRTTISSHITLNTA